MIWKRKNGVFYEGDYVKDGDYWVLRIVPFNDKTVMPEEFRNTSKWCINYEMRGLGFEEIRGFKSYVQRLYDYTISLTCPNCGGIFEYEESKDMSFPPKYELKCSKCKYHTTSVVYPGMVLKGISETEIEYALESNGDSLANIVKRNYNK